MFGAGVEMMSGFLLFFGIIMLIALAVVVVQIVAFWQIYKKAGKGGWEAIIPYYNNWILVEIAGLDWWWFLLLLVPVITSFIDLAWLGTLVSLFASFNCYYNISKKFNKGVGFAICFTLFTPICACILGFSKDEVYDKNVVVSSNGVFKDNKDSNNNQTSTQTQYNNESFNQNYNQQPIMNNNQSASKFCINCGSRINTEDKFCMNCGTKL